MILPRLEKVFEDWADNDGIFSRMETQHNDLPWADIISGTELDMLYYGQHSGGKNVSPFVVRMMDDDMTLSNNRKNVISNVIYKKYIERWTKLYDTYSFEYDPIYNYNVIEHEETKDVDDSTTARTGNDKLTSTGTITTEEEHSGTDTTNNTVNNTNTANGSQYAFNSTDASPFTTDSGTSNTTDNTSMIHGENIDTVRENDTTETTTYNSQNKFDREDNITRDLTRKGNIGVTTTQKLITEEREVWMWDFYNFLFKCADEVLTINVYGDDIVEW